MKNMKILIPITVGLMICFYLLGCGNVTGGGGGGGGGSSGTSTIYVSKSGSDESGDGSAAHPYRTIQKGLDTIKKDGTVSVESGVYIENLVWPSTEGGTLQGASMSTTTLDANNAGRGILISQSETIESVTIRNMTIKNGSTGGYGGGIDFNQENATLNLYNILLKSNTAYYGAGLGIEQPSTVILSSCEVSENNAAIGGGIGCDYTITPTTIEAIRCRIINNNAGSKGGGIGNYPGTITLTSCEVSGNTAALFGGVYCGGGETINCLIYNNTSSNTGGINTGGLYCGYSNAEIINCTVTSNESASGCGGIFDAGVVTIINCIVWGNTVSSVTSEIGGITAANITYSDVRGSYTGTGNVNYDPHFNSVSDLHLTSSTTTEITQGGTIEGAPACDYDGNPRTAPYSMGAFK